MQETRASREARVSQLYKFIQDPQRSNVGSAQRDLVITLEGSLVNLAIWLF